MAKHRTALIFGVLLLVLTAGCNFGGPSRSQTVKALEMGSRWPLTVEKGTVICENPRMKVVVFQAPNGKKYALNNSAKLQGYPSIDPIRHDQATGHFTEANNRPLARVGLNLCR